MNKKLKFELREKAELCLDELIGAEEDSRLEEIAHELVRLRELESRIRERCRDAVPGWAPEIRELLEPDA